MSSSGFQGSSSHPTPRHDFIKRTREGGVSEKEGRDFTGILSFRQLSLMMTRPITPPLKGQQSSQ